MDRNSVVSFTKGVLDRIRDHMGEFMFDPMPFAVEMWSVSNNEDKFRGCIFLSCDMYLRKMRYTIDHGQVSEYGLMNGPRPGMERVGIVTGIHAVNWARVKHNNLYRAFDDQYHFQYNMQKLDSSYVIEGNLVALFDESGLLDTLLELETDGGKRHAA